LIVECFVIKSKSMRLVEKTATMSCRQADQNSVSPHGRRQAKQYYPRGRGWLTQTTFAFLFTLSMLSCPVQAWYGAKSEEPRSKDGAHQTINTRFDDDGLDSDYESSQKKISAMNVLLPISNCAECRKVKYELSATNGCYIW